MSFAAKLIGWQRRHGRHGLPWQGTRDPYRIWLSEVMLQQTQVAAVIAYYERFLRRFPSVGALASASEDEVLQLWSGLGYYARGRNLHKAAQAIAQRGAFPRTAAELQALPGVGRSTAAAIAVFAYGERAAILDANAKRVLARCFGVSGDLWPRAERLLPKRDIETYTQALMDLGATVCTRTPQCGGCPVRQACVARRTGRIDKLPARLSKKPLPQKSVHWYIYRRGTRVLLERRPSPGIWGGLLCFPERESSAARHLPKTALPPIEHGFTHFRLRIHPVLCDAKPDLKGEWLDVRDATDAAVPTPVRKLLQDLPRIATRKSGGRR
jgi:A/G-specific adenine glycosylase